MTFVLYSGKPYNNNPVSSGGSKRNLLPMVGVTILPLMVMLVGWL